MITKRASLHIAVYATLLFPSICLAQHDSTTEPLKQVLNNKLFVLVSPAESWPYPGGFLVANKHAATFISLPKDIPKPQASSASADFPEVSQKHTFSITAILTGMQALLGGNPGGGFGHSSNLTFQELHAAGTRIEYEDAQNLVKNAEVASGVKKWLSKPGQQVFIVGTTLTTKSISISSGNNTNLDLSFNGSPISKCSDTSSGDSKTGTDKTSSDTTTKGTASPTTKSSTAASPKAKSAPAGSTAKTTTAASMPGGELHLCTGGSNTLKMSSDTPLVFAASAYRISLLKTGELDVEPILGVPSGGKAENSERLTPHQIAASIDARWSQSSWEKSSK